MLSPRYYSFRYENAMLELTCPLDSVHHIQSALSRKQSAELTASSTLFVKKMLDDVVCKSISSSEINFLAQLCKEWMDSANHT